jgi:hypothetical protein
MVAMDSGMRPPVVDVSTHLQILRDAIDDLCGGYGSSGEAALEAIDRIGAATGASASAAVPVADIFEAFAAARLRKGEYLKLTIEEDREPSVEEASDQAPLYCCTIMEEPPDGGWPSEGAYFGHPADRSTNSEPTAKRWRYDHVARVSISAETPEDATRLTIGMLASLPEKR